jgi:hypothetical protein
VIANGNASLHNLVMIALDILGPQYDYKGLRLALIAILDMVVIFSPLHFFFSTINFISIYNKNLFICFLF